MRIPPDGEFTKPGGGVTPRLPPSSPRPTPSRTWWGGAPRWPHRRRWRAGTRGCRSERRSLTCNAFPTVICGCGEIRALRCATSWRKYWSPGGAATAGWRIPGGMEGRLPAGARGGAGGVRVSSGKKGGRGRNAVMEKTRLPANRAPARRPELYHIFPLSPPISLYFG